MSSQPSQPSQPCEPCEPPKKSEKQLALVELLMQHIESFQSGAANEMTYLSAMNALRDLHAYVKKAEKMQEAAILLITIDGEEFFVEEYQDVRIAIRFSDNYAFSSDTGDFVGVWNEETRTLSELSLDDEQ